MASKPFDLIPLLRVPTFFISTLGLILSSVSISVTDNYWNWNGGIHDVMCALVSFYASSMITTAAFIYFAYRRGGLTLSQGRSFVPTALVQGIVDTATGVTLLVLHILVSVNATRASDSILHMYSGFGALPASIFHCILAVHSFVAAARSHQLTKTYCPTCSQRLRRCDSPIQHGVLEADGPSFRDERKSNATPVANREGSLEGDRLIVPGGDEA